MKKTLSLCVVSLLILSSLAAGGKKETPAPDSVAPQSAPAAIVKEEPKKEMFPYSVVTKESVSSLSNLYKDEYKAEIVVSETLKGALLASFPEFERNIVVVASDKDAENAVKENSFLVAILPAGYKTELPVLSFEL